MNYYYIRGIYDLNHNPRTDGRYPLRIGRRFGFLLPLQVGARMRLEYCPRIEDKHFYYGVLRTSAIQNIQITFDGMEITTQNSVYDISEEKIPKGETIVVKHTGVFA